MSGEEAMTTAQIIKDSFNPIADFAVSSGDIRQRFVLAISMSAYRRDRLIATV